MAALPKRRLDGVSDVTEQPLSVPAALTVQSREAEPEVPSVRARSGKARLIWAALGWLAQRGLVMTGGVRVGSTTAGCSTGLGFSNAMTGPGSVRCGARDRRRR
jgi:hypothetical protein